VRVIEERQTFIYFDKDVDEPKPPIEVSRTGLKKPMTTVPSSLTVQWKKGSRFHGPEIGWWDSGVWDCVEVTIYANRVHSASLKPYGSESVGIRYGGHWSDARPFEELPEWASTLVAKTFPGVTAPIA
jgi:hypothetical protein